MKILVIGGAGYIGSHVLKLLKTTNYKIEVLDNLSAGLKENVQGLKLHLCDLSNVEKVYRILDHNKFDSIMHFAGSINVSESYNNPKKYYDNNVVNTINLLNCMVDLKIKNFIFSSSAAVYGDNSKNKPIKEDFPIRPVNPYGNTKAIVERILEDYDKSYDLKYVTLRYFNACGAHLDGTIGEKHEPETHIIPIILQVASGRRDKIEIYGKDYETKDGTCIRDYIHVMDLAEAHLKALEKLVLTRKSKVFNVGNSRGYSISEIIKTIEEITKKNIKLEFKPRRSGDPATLIANNEKIKLNLNWKPNYSDLNTIIKTAWQWEKTLANSI